MKDSKTIALFSFFFLIVFAFISLTTSFTGEYSSGLQVFLDETLIQFFLNSRNIFVSIIAKDLTSLGSLTVTFVILMLISTALFKFKKTKEIIFLLAVWAGCAVIPWVSKLIFGRARPLEEDRLIIVHDLSFPSGHSFVAAAVFIALSYLYYRVLNKAEGSLTKFILMGFSLASVVGLSRIYLGVHYTTDIVAGLALGSFWTLAVALFFESRVFPKNKDAI